MSQETSLLPSCRPEIPLQNAALNRTTTGINDGDADKIMWSVQPPLPIWDDILFAILLNWYHHHHEHHFWLHKSYLCQTEFLQAARDVFSAVKTVKRSSHLVIMLATEHCKQIIFGNRKVRKDKFLFPKPNVLLITFGNERKLTIKLLVQLSISIFLLMDTTLSFVKKSTFYWGSQHELRGKPFDFFCPLQISLSMKH